MFIPISLSVAVHSWPWYDCNRLFISLSLASCSYSPSSSSWLYPRCWLSFLIPWPPVSVHLFRWNSVNMFVKASCRYEPLMLLHYQDLGKINRGSWSPVQAPHFKSWSHDWINDWMTSEYTGDIAEVLALGQNPYPEERAWGWDERNDWLDMGWQWYSSIMSASFTLWPRSE